ncbi:hypothetical protein AB5J72_22730 [Streptomyces sp. CG1]|uniref:hypothetical protein n=1 Tax=Streptomyces sp. CG1 TaxID=1287523 RepID=UPI0034E21C68
MDALSLRQTDPAPATGQASAETGPPGGSQPVRSPSRAMAVRLCSGVAAARKLWAERAGLVHGTPSTVERDVYQVPLPHGALRPLLTAEPATTLQPAR